MRTDSDAPRDSRGNLLDGPRAVDIETSNTTADLRGIHSIGGGVAWASGTNGTVLRTEDGGYLWQSCTVPPGAEKLDFRGIQAFDANTAIVMSSGKGDLSRLYKTTDGCHSWKLVFTNPDKDGFWDAIKMTRPNTLIVLGDAVRSEGLSRLRSPHSLPTFRFFASYDAGESWHVERNRPLFALASPDGQPEESIFAASNSSFLTLSSGAVSLFVTGGQRSSIHYSQFLSHPPSILCKGPCSIESETASALPTGESAGGFSVAEDTTNRTSAIVLAVGGDYRRPESSTGTASVCLHNFEGVFIHFKCESAATPPRGYRSAVAYDPTTKTWITVGPNGTDISTDDGKNWRALHPDAALHEAPDADRNWNALSLPFVVGPHGRIGKLDESALTH